MAVTCARSCFLSKEKKYKVASSTQDAQSCMANCPDSTYLEVEHLTPHENIIPRRGHKTLGCIVVVLIISVFLNVTVAVYLWTYQRKVYDTAPPPHSDRLGSAVPDDSLCTSCRSLGINPEIQSRNEFLQLSVHQLQDNSFLCCLHNVASLKQLVQIFTDRTLLDDRRRVSNRIPAQTSPGAHLFVDVLALKNRLAPSLSWTTEYGFGAAYINGVTVHDNQLVVTRPGLYHVYSFFTFKTRQQRPAPDNILHTLYRTNKKLPALGSSLMLFDKKTLPEVSEKFVTSYLSATVRLRSDDQLYVKVSNLSYVYPYSPSNFFGIFFIGE